MGVGVEDLLGLSWPDKPDPSAPCSYAAEFQAFCDTVLSQLDDLTPAALEVAIANAKRELFDRYLDFVTDTPPGHTNAAGRKASKHRCIVAVLNDTGRTIRMRERTLPPAPLVSKVKKVRNRAEPTQSWAEELATKLTS